MPSRLFSDLKEAEIAVAYLADTSVPRLAEQYATTTTMIQNVLRRTKTPFRPRGTLTTDGRQRMVAVRHKHRRYRFNERFFQTVDTPAKARWLGFIAADGCVCPSGRNNMLTIALKGGDTDHLQCLASAMDYVGPIIQTSATDGSGSGIRHPIAKLSLYSDAMLNDLACQGVLPRKSLVLEPWQGASDLQRFWLAGYFDGDGCLHKEKRSLNGWKFHVVGTLSVMKSFQSFLNASTGSLATIRQYKNIFKIDSGGINLTRKLAFLFYRDLQGSVPLDRKYRLAQRLFD